ncbi:MAG: anaerobic ribonucleoside-triphosphate reductase activating protein [Spirochaetes bacterium]|jgi:pyruvate formate lyase activating enzyme|nr:anaerobic ribonucleoside-triphosphate reductase activating protein [Spirochaetota bacterium]
MALDKLGLVKTSLVDFPGKVAATLFTHGCNLRCPYCHNANLVTGGVPDDFLPRAEVLDFLARRRKLLDGVAVTGGEPLLHSDLDALIAEIRDLGLMVKVDTNGLLPERLEALDADYVAMDLKTAPERYPELADPGTARREPPSSAGERIRASLAVLRDRARTGRWDYELRTTVVPELVTQIDVEEIAALLTPGERIVLAPFRGGRTLDPAYADTPPPAPALLQQFAEILRESGSNVILREA